MNGRLAVGIGALVLLGALAGCTSVFGPGDPDPDRIQQSVEYDWDTTANATINVTQNEYRSVYVIDNRSEIELYRRTALGTEDPLPIEGLKFRYRNGTTTNVSVDDVELTRERAVVTLPEDGGKLAFSVARNGKSWSNPTFVEGSYEVTLPERARVGVPLLAQVSPGGYDERLADNRVTLTWEDVEDVNAISIRWYLDRDLWLFGGLLTIAIALGVGGAVYYLRQIRQLKERREEVGLDVDYEDDEFDDGPPPGMR